MSESNISLFKMPENGETVSILVLSDLHSEHCDMAALEATLKFFEKTPKSQRRIFLLGDILSMDAFMSKSDSFKHAKKYKDIDGYFLPEAEKEFAWWYGFIKMILTYVDLPEHVTKFCGNHLQRLERPDFINFIPYGYKHNFNIEKQLKIKEYGINYIRYNDWLRVETKEKDLMFTHGVYCGANPIKKHVDVAKCAVMFGHTHEMGLTSFKTVTGTLIGYNNPCMCNIRPKYLEGIPHNWSIGFTTVQVTTERFFVHQHEVIDGQLIDATGATL